MKFTFFHRLLGLLLIFQFLAIPGKTQSSEFIKKGGPWELEKDGNGIRVYSSSEEGNAIKGIKVTCVLEGTLSELVALLSDIKNYQQVVYRTDKAYTLKKVSEQELLYYTIISFPWPADNRDLVIRLKFIPDKGNSQLIVQSEKVPGIKPVNGEYVRIPYWRAEWIARKIDATHMKIEYFVRVNPGGSLPNWLVNLTISKGPYQSFVNLKKNLKLPRYQNKEYSFLNF